MLKNGMSDFTQRRRELLEFVARRSVCRGKFTLVSGAESDFYIDSKLSTLDPQGAFLAGSVGWELIKRRGLKIDSLGGLTMGADAISLAVGLASFAAQPESHLQTFTVRKTTKAHGRQKLIEGNFKAGDRVVVVDDVITTGGSTITAIEAIEAAGGKIEFALVLVDRQEGGRANIEARGIPVEAMLLRDEVLAAYDRMNAESLAPTR
jgi:orotate phosphoribosyltransferase